MEKIKIPSLLTPAGREFAKALIFFVLFVLLLGWAGNSDREFQELENEVRTQILEDNGIITNKNTDNGEYRFSSK